MTDSYLLSYVGAITGVLGAVTGIAGAIMGYLSYRKTDKIKAIELRLELMKTGVEVFQKADELGELLTRAEGSRNAVAAAMGNRSSGAHEHWMKQHKLDQESLTYISDSVDELNVDYSNTPVHELERAIVDVHALRTIVAGLTDKYLKAIAEDDRNREFIREQAHERTNH